MGNAGTIWRCRNQSVAQLFNHVWNVSGPGAWCASWKIYVGVNLCVLCTIECMRSFVAVSLSEASALCVFIAIELSTWCSWQKCIELNVIHRKFGIVCAAPRAHTHRMNVYLSTGNRFDLDHVSPIEYYCELHRPCVAGKMFILYYVSFNHLPEHLDACVCVWSTFRCCVGIAWNENGNHNANAFAANRKTKHNPTKNREEYKCLSSSPERFSN